VLEWGVDPLVDLLQAWRRLSREDLGHFQQL